MAATSHAGRHAADGARRAAGAGGNALDAAVAATAVLYASSSRNPPASAATASASTPPPARERCTPLNGSGKAPAAATIDLAQRTASDKCDREHLAARRHPCPVR